MVIQLRHLTVDDEVVAEGVPHSVVGQSKVFADLGRLRPPSIFSHHGARWGCRKNQLADSPHQQSGCWLLVSALKASSMALQPAIQPLSIAVALVVLADPSSGAAFEG